MKTTINLHNFRSAFDGLKSRYTNITNFSYDGLEALFNYLEEEEASCGTESEFDPVGLCTLYTEYETWEEFQNDYPDLDDDELRNRTPILWFDGEHDTKSFIVRTI